MNKKPFILSIILSCVSLTGCCDGHEHVFDKKNLNDAFLASEATCTKEAQYYYSCECGQASEETFSVDGLKEHDFGEFKTTKSATCTQKGSGYKECQNCNLKQESSIDRISHKPEATWSFDENTHWNKCTYGCNSKCNESTHKYGELVITKQGSHNENVEGYYECITCGYKTYINVPETGHEAFNDYSCDENGHWYSCKKTDCTEKIDFEYHDFDRHINTGATCTKGGNGYEVCKICQYRRDFILDPVGHSPYSVWDYNETQHWHNCKKCADKINPENHTFGDLIIDTDSTCVTKGRGHYICQLCKYRKDVELDYTDHEASTLWSNDETQHWHACKNCNEKFELGNHNFGDVIVDCDATCSQDGYGHQICNDCGYIKENVAIHVGHNFGEEWANDETKHWHKCTDCDEITGTAQHSFGDLVVDTEPTLDNKGAGHYACEVCNYEKEVVLGKVVEGKEDQYFVLESYVSPSDTSCGNEHYVSTSSDDSYDEIIPHTGDHIIDYIYYDNKYCCKGCTIEGCNHLEPGTNVGHYIVEYTISEPEGSNPGKLGWVCGYCGSTFGSAGEFDGTRVDEVTITSPIPKVGETFVSTLETSSGVFSELSSVYYVCDPNTHIAIEEHRISDPLPEDVEGYLIEFYLYVEPDFDHYFYLNEKGLPVVDIIWDGATIIPLTSARERYGNAFAITVEFIAEA